MWAWEAGFRVAEGWVQCDLSDMISRTNEREVCEMFNEGRGESRGGINTRLLGGRHSEEGMLEIITALGMLRANQ